MQLTTRKERTIPKRSQKVGGALCSLIPRFSFFYGGIDAPGNEIYWLEMQKSEAAETKERSFLTQARCFPCLCFSCQLTAFLMSHHLLVLFAL